jgi:putative methyltransferase (TIGR04325 family)
VKIESLLRKARGRLSLEQPFPKLELNGDYANWTEARQHSSGYDATVILQKTRDSLLRVKRGEAAFERDSVTFETIEYNWPVLAGLMYSAALSASNLNVVDFGGSLGSVYFQHRDFLNGLSSVKWNVVEQPHYVDAGRKDFQDQQLKFYRSIDECLIENRPNVGLLSSVLQYVEDPFNVLRDIAATSINTLIIDRTPFSHEDRDRLCVQTVPAEIYLASYPSWIFSKTKFLAALDDTWACIASFPSKDVLSGPIELAYEGLIVVRKTSVR